MAFIVSDTFKNLFIIISPKDAGFEDTNTALSIMDQFYPLQKKQTKKSNRNKNKIIIFYIWL